MAGFLEKLSGNITLQLWNLNLKFYDAEAAAAVTEIGWPLACFGNIVYSCQNGYLQFYVDVTFQKSKLKVKELSGRRKRRGRKKEKDWTDKGLAEKKV